MERRSIECCENQEFPFHVYVRDDKLVWVPAEILTKYNDQTVKVRTTHKAEPFIVELRDYRGLELPKYSTKPDEDDLADLEHLHEASILHTLRVRNEAGKPYTRASTTAIIATNPFEWHEHLYSHTSRQKYAQELVWKKYDENRKALEPHLYEVSSRAYAELMIEQRNQSIIMSGESGSGKTESAKLLLRHVADISGTKGKVVPRILVSHPCLEAFGNAVTVWNDNSSRFGKYIQLQFDSSGQIPVLVGSCTRQYLLETARVCQHASEERSFHIFYQLLASSTKHQYWEGLREKSVTDFKYLGWTCIEQIEGVSDAASFSKTIQALQTCNVDAGILMQAVCITLQLGNLTFGTCTENNDRTVVTSQEELHALSELIGISMDVLTSCLTERTMKTIRGESFNVCLSASQSQEACDALAKEIYSKSFQWLVRAINKGTEVAHCGGTIGLLDIFGFESFKTNRFEQLCINYANEKLQQKAMNDIFRKTKNEYESEGIYLKEVDFLDNQSVLAILECKLTGVIALLDEQCHLPSGGSDRAFAQRSLDQHKHSKYIVGPSQKRFTSEFGIIHYAGLVMYDSDGFVNKNKDRLPLDLKHCMEKSSNQIVALHAIDAPPTCLQLQEGGDCCSTASLSTFASSVPCLEGGCVSATSGLSTKRRLQDRANFLAETISIGTQHQPTKEPLIVQMSACRPASFASPSSDSLDAIVRQNTFGNEPGMQIRVSHSSAEIHECSKESIHRTHSAPLPIQTPPQSKAKTTHCFKRAESDLRTATVWTKYQGQLNSLLDMLNQTQSRYVRCIKPNSQRQPRVTDYHSTVEQLRCSGLVNIAKLSRATYATSLQNKVLRFRYKAMWNQTKFPSKAKRMDKGNRKLRLECEALLASALEPLKDSKNQEAQDLPFAIGKTRTYFKKMEFFQR